MRNSWKTTTATLYHESLFEWSFRFEFLSRLQWLKNFFFLFHIFFTVQDVHKREYTNPVYFRVTLVTLCSCSSHKKLGSTFVKDIWLSWQTCSKRRIFWEIYCLTLRHAQSCNTILNFLLFSSSDHLQDNCSMRPGMRWNIIRAEEKDITSPYTHDALRIQFYEGKP